MGQSYIAERPINKKTIPETSLKPRFNPFLKQAVARKTFGESAPEPAHAAHRNTVCQAAFIHDFRRTGSDASNCRRYGLVKPKR
jgi:hypothetical protein